MSKTVLVTGGAGYIGSHCVLDLLQADYQVVAIDNFVNSKSCSNGQHSPALRRVEEITGKKIIFHQCDLLNSGELNGVFDLHSIDCVIHFAALKAVGESMHMPLAYYKNNIIGAINLLEVMRSHEVFQLVFSSSCCVYGDPATLPITEQHPIGEVTNVYGRTKYLLEKMFQDLAQSDKVWNIVSLRYFNPVGAHPSGRIGEDPTRNFSNLMPFLAQVAVGNKPFLEIFGTDYDTEDGTGVRDYLHIMDLASGHVAALNKLFQTHYGYKAFNLGVGRGLSVRELIEVWQRTTGVSIAVRETGRRVGDVPSLVCDPTAANTELAWTARYSPEDMCRDTWRWQVNNPHGYQDNADDVSDVPAKQKCVVANGNGVAAHPGDDAGATNGGKVEL